MGRAARVVEAGRLRAAGLSVREICAEMGLCRSAVAAYFTDPDLEQQRARRAEYGRLHPCLSCGDPTDGSRGTIRSADYCERCVGDAQKVWTAERIIEAVQVWAAEHGRPPIVRDWARSSPDGRWPAATSTYDGANPSFSSWSDVIEAAGFPRPYQGFRQGEARRKEGEVPARYLRAFVVLEQASDGRWIEHGPVEGLTAAVAVETVAEKGGVESGGGVFVAFSVRQWVPMRVARVQRFQAVKMEDDGRDS